MSNNILDTLISQLSAANDDLEQAKVKVTELRQLVMDELKDQGKLKFKGTFGSVSLVNTNNWLFSNKIVKLTEKLKAQKAIEQRTGVAIITSVTESIRVTFS